MLKGLPSKLVDKIPKHNKKVISDSDDDEEEEEPEVLPM